MSDPSLPPPFSLQVCAEYKKANALIRQSDSSNTAKVWGRLHAEIEKVRAGCSRGKHCIGWREVRIR